MFHFDVNDVLFYIVWRQMKKVSHVSHKFIKYNNNREIIMHVRLSIIVQTKHCKRDRDSQATVIYVTAPIASFWK